MGFGGAWFLCKYAGLLKYANRTASRESHFLRFDTWLQYTENKGFEQINFIKGSLNTDHEIDVILNPPESKLRIEAENISIEVLLIGIVPRTPPRLVDRRFHSWSDHPVNTSSVPLDIFSVYELNLMNYLHCVTAILCSYFCPPPPHSPTTLQCNTLTDNLNEFDSKIWLLFQKSRHGSCHNETFFDREIFKTFQCSYSTWETEAVSWTRLIQGYVYYHLL